MPSPATLVKTNAPYAYAALGIVWLVIAAYEGSLLLLWPVVALITGGALRKLRPRARITWAWVVSAAVLGLVLAFWQAYVAAPLVSGVLSAFAGASLVAFAILGIAHLVLLYAGASGAGAKPRESGSS